MGSNRQGLRLRVMQQAAQQVVSTLTVADRVALVPFASTARKIAEAGTFLYPATATNKEYLIHAIDDLEAVGETNF